MIYAIAAVVALVALALTIWLAWRSHCQYEDAVRHGTLAEMGQNGCECPQCSAVSSMPPYANDPAYLKEAEGRN